MGAKLLILRAGLVVLLASGLLLTRGPTPPAPPPTWVGGYEASSEWRDGYAKRHPNSDILQVLGESTFLPWISLKADGAAQVLQGYLPGTEVYKCFQGSWKPEGDAIQITASYPTRGEHLVARVWRDGAGALWYERTDRQTPVGVVQLQRR